MTIRKTPLENNEYYHIYNRGNSKQKIFFCDKDYEHFIKLLYLCNSTKSINFREDIIKKKISAWDFDRDDQIVSIGAYCLMPNHFHLYLTFAKGRTFGKDKQNNISLFMRKLCTSYTMYFNKKYGRTGSLFEGRFKSVHIEDDIQAKYLFSYIHLNPVKLIQSDWKEKGIKYKNTVLKFLETYKWSSYQDFIKIKRKENIILNLENFPNYFTAKEKFRKEIFEWVQYKDSK